MIGHVTNLAPPLRRYNVSIRRWRRRDTAPLNTGRGGYKMGRGALEVLTLQKRGGGEVLAMLKGANKKFWCSFYAVA